MCSMSLMKWSLPLAGLGHWFASKEVFDFQPDIICSAKGLTSGYQPLGATIYSSDIHQVISELGHGRCFTHGLPIPAIRLPVPRH